MAGRAAGDGLSDPEREDGAGPDAGTHGTETAPEPLAVHGGDDGGRGSKPPCSQFHNN
jgi:hypothetical protein